MIKCLIVDDEPLATDVLKRYIESLPFLELKGVYHNPMEAFAALQTVVVDIIFLDIQMPGLTGMALLKSLPRPPQVVFTTAYRDFAADAFDLNVLDYLVKPISRERFLKAVARFQSFDSSLSQEKVDRPFIFLKVEKETVKVFLDEILYIEALKNYSRLVTKSGQHIVYYTLAYLEERLPSSLFKRVHKSFIVSLDKVEKFVTGSLTIAGKEIAVGQTYQQEVDEILKRRMI